MFERYTERARRVIFFSRYEASQFGSTKIEADHLLLGLLREDKALIDRFFPAAVVEDMRRKVEEHIPRREKVATSVDLPLSEDGMRILAYAHEESERLAHRFIGTQHLLLGILREETCFARRILTEGGLELGAAREQLAVAQEAVPPFRGDRAAIHALVDRLPESALERAHSILQHLL